MIKCVICLGGPCTPLSSSLSNHQHLDKFQNELKTKMLKKRKKRLKRQNSRVRISSLDSSDLLRCSNSRKYSTTSNNVVVVTLKEKCNQSSSTKNVLLESNLNCLNASENMDEKVVNDNGGDDDDYDDDKVEEVAYSSNNNRLSSHFLYPQFASFKNCISTFLQRLSLNTNTTSNESSSSTTSAEQTPFVRPNNTATLTKFYESHSKRSEIDAARNEVKTVRAVKMMKISKM